MLGDTKVTNITSISIKGPPTHEQAARATFPYGTSDPEQLFPYGPNAYLRIKCNEDTGFDDRFLLLVGPISGCCFGQGLSSVCGCACVCVWLSDTIG